jgi:protein-S-isoprenylcysteine O-methyltransferase Ste14
MRSGEAVTDGAAVRLFPPLVPLAAVLAGFGLSRLWPLETGLRTAVPWLSTVGNGVVVAAVALAVWALFLVHRSGQDPTPWKPTPEIIEAGPYRFSRNPMYLALVLLCFGSALHRADLWVLAMTPLAGWVLQRWVIVPEETYLEAKFGDRYRSYRRRVRRWI